MVMAPSMPSEKLNLINNVQQLGVSLHFENEIEEVLQQIHKTIMKLADMFNKFKDVHGKFKESLATDAVGLLSLFEAAHVEFTERTC
ncbi:(-)-germacrene D synthase-like [Pyrus ussuriensis x Pyrus communis]|uniref:(-)-germacrene D synthase-like n=1 Tax=Pyrus ussuriensis x Pyrus communis TaxID=2448454 RepID=A0A5N5FRM1_9ROSA|nr:(-)-germacrene D synthase-like [Pyrus ussuriensis x Pyrus communis]